MLPASFYAIAAIALCPILNAAGIIGNVAGNLGFFAGVVEADGFQLHFGAQAVELCLREARLLHLQFGEGLVQRTFYRQLFFEADVAFAEELDVGRVLYVEAGG